MKLKRVLLNDRAGPHPAHQVVLSDQFVGCLNQNCHNLKGTVSKRDRNAARPEFPPMEIDFPLS
jgi:hypothetical protein